MRKLAKIADALKLPALAAAALTVDLTVSTAALDHALACFNVAYVLYLGRAKPELPA